MVVDDLPHLDSAADLLSAALLGGDAASLLIKAGTRQREIAHALIGPSRGHGLAFMVENDVALAASLDADGVQLKAVSPVDVSSTKRVVGPQAIVGVDCGVSRHSAMLAGEAGADYVGFSGLSRDAAGEGIINWWANLFELPCVVLDELSEADARGFVLHGADFITPPSILWQSNAAATNMVRSFNAMIDECTR
jgi:thiamine-phosphate pyrophosphorylase